ncbi:toprim domain-containing protein [Pedobacter sp. KACC 23697]|uniref:Toprim domain-containing protein n=1 Tax=Pedobacter sp. KACC 23697 TaxID=3149230 RepID=A0AAU7K716_9SPHI
MNIEQAKGIPMSEILNKLNLKPQKNDDKGMWYFSPFRKEKTPSFHISTHHNIWYDFGEAKGGDTITFVRYFLNASNESDTVADALRWLKNMIGTDAVSLPVFVGKEMPATPKLELKRVSKVRHLGLRNYLSSRGIALNVADRYLKQLEVLNRTTGKTITSLGLENEEDGYELRNPMFKGCVGPKAISFIRGNKPKPRGINVFEGMFDFLSIISEMNGKHLENDIIILNSTSMLNEAIPYIKNYGYEVLYSWMDNDEAGATAAMHLEEFCSTEEQLLYRPMQSKYASFSDVNAWHMNKLNLN